MTKAGAGGGARPQLDLAFARAPSGETFLARQYAAFPFHVTQPFMREGEATVILQGLGAGFLAGDRFRSRIAAGAGARARVTTQGSTLVHAMPGGGARQTVTLEAEAGALLAWLPRPLILFPGARLAATPRDRAARRRGRRLARCLSRP